MWADHFYALRNRIIHGEKIKGSDYDFMGKQHFFDSATLFFALGIKKLIGKCNGFQETYDEITWKKHTETGQPTNSDFNYEGFVYSDLDMWTKIIHI